MTNNDANWFAAKLNGRPVPQQPPQQYPPQPQQYPPQYPQQYPPQQPYYPPQQGQYPPQQHYYPPQQPYYPPQQPYYPPQQGYPPQGYPQQGFPPLMDERAMYIDMLKSTGKQVPKSYEKDDRCPGCGGPNYVMTGKVTSMQGRAEVWRCYDCGYPIEQSGSHNDGSTYTGETTAATQIQTGGWNPQTIIGRVE